MKKFMLALFVLAAPVAALAAPGSTVTIAAKPTTVQYNAMTTLSGKTQPGNATAKVQILNRACGQSSFSPKPKTDTTTARDGTYKVTVHVTMKTGYEAKVKNTTSNTAVVLVRPKMNLRKVAAHTFKTSVTAARSFAGKFAVFQRWSVVKHKWVRVRYVTLHFDHNGTAPTIVSGAKFTSSIATGRKVRTILPAKQAAPCYIGGKSNKITS